MPQPRVKAETAWLVFVVAALAAALALGCGNVESRPAGELDAGQLEEAAAGGRAGVDGAGELGVGGAGGAQLDASAAADVGPHVGASTAPACRGSFVGSSEPCGEIGATYQCEVGCSSSAADNAAGCLFYGVTYCVPSCSACVF